MCKTFLISDVEGVFGMRAAATSVSFRFVIVGEQWQQETRHVQMNQQIYCRAKAALERLSG